MHAIETDLPRKLLRITMSGFFSGDRLESLMLDLRNAIAVVSRDCAYFVLVDIRDCALQSQDVVEAFRQFILARPHHAKRIALLVGKSVSRMQARRLLIDARVRMFEGDDEALGWVTPSSDEA